MFAVIKKELKSYLLTPVGYTYIGIFLALFSLFFIINVYGGHVLNFEYLFGNGATVLTFITPILTMRMFAEERRNGTEQLILTSPRSITSIVLGKFFAATIVMAITELLTFIYFGILCYFGDPSFKVALVTILGFFLLSMAYLSFGMFASSLTENQVIASVLPIAVFLMMWFLPSFNQNLEIFSLIYLFDKFPSGIILIPNVIAFMTFTVLFILLTILVLQRRKNVK